MPISKTYVCVYVQFDFLRIIIFIQFREVTNFLVNFINDVSGLIKEISFFSEYMTSHADFMILQHPLSVIISIWTTFKKKQLSYSKYVKFMFCLRAKFFSTLFIVLFFFENAWIKKPCYFFKKQNCSSQTRLTML